MKRTPEIIFGIIGLLVYVFVAAIGGFVIWIQNNEDKMKSILLENGAEDVINDFNFVFDNLGNSGWMITIIAAIAIIAGIIAMILVKGNKKPKAAGITFIATAIIVSIASFGMGIVGGIFYVIAGILCLVRKG